MCPVRPTIQLSTRVTRVPLGAWRFALSAAKARLSQYFHRKRTPDQSTVRLLNHAFALPVGVADAEHYLQAVVVHDGLIDPSTDDLGRLGAGIELLRPFDTYFVDRARSAAIAAVNEGKLSVERRVALLNPLVAMRGRHLLNQLDGRAPRDLSLDEVLWLFRKAHAPLEPWLRSDDELQLRRARDRFGLLVDGAIAELVSDIDVPVERRQAATRRIMEAYAGTATLVAARTLAASRPREVAPRVLSRSNSPRRKS